MTTTKFARTGLQCLWGGLPLALILLVATLCVAHAREVGFRNTECNLDVQPARGGGWKIVCDL